MHWALTTAGLPPSRIALVGQSLGTAVTFAVAEALSNPPPTDPPTEPITLGAVISVAGFSNMPDLIKTYYAGGIVPILAPLNPYPRLQSFFTSFVWEKWDSAARVASLVQHCEKLKLFIIHAKSDNSIPWLHSDYLFHAAANATGVSKGIGEGTEEALGFADVRRLVVRKQLGEEGFVNSWPEERSGGRLIEQWVVTWGGKYFRGRVGREMWAWLTWVVEHNRIMTSASVSLLVARALGL